MTVFKACLKIIKKNAGLLSIYIFVCVFMSVMFSQTNDYNSDTGFEYTKIKAAIINKDTDGVLSKGLVDYIGTKVERKNIKEDNIGIRDALLYREAEYILIIPENYSSDFFAGKNPKLEKMEIMGSYSGTFVNAMIESYLNTVSVYMKSINGISLEKAVEKTNEVYKESIEVTVDTEEKEVNDYPQKSYFKFCIYAIIVTLILGTGLIVSKFNETELKKRNLVSPVSETRMNMYQLMGNLIFGIAVWGILTAAAVIIYGKSVFTPGGLLLVINMFVASMMALAIGFLISKFGKTKNSISAMANTIGLGCSFIGGVFVPMEMMGKTVGTIAKVTPTYWYIRTVDNITSIEYNSESFNMWNSMKGVYGTMLVEVIYGIVCLAIGLLISKLRNNKNK